MSVTCRMTPDPVCGSPRTEDAVARFLRDGRSTRHATAVVASSTTICSALSGGASVLILGEESADDAHDSGPAYGHSCHAGPDNPRTACGPGQGGTGRGAALEPRGVHRRSGPHGPARPPGRPGPHAGAGAAADPLRPDGVLGVRLLPWRGTPDGQRPGADSAVGADRADLRRCPPGELRCVRLARAAPRLRHQRL